MNHDHAHCTGSVGAQTCDKRDRCLRYLLHLDAQERHLTHVPYLSHIADLGYGKAFTYDIRHGCCEYEQWKHQITSDSSGTTPCLRRASLQ